MKTTVLSVLGCVIIATGALQARAQTTNVTLNVNIALTGVAQTNGDSVARVRIGTRDVINAIGGTNTTFSTRAKLVAISSLGGGGGPSFVIREGTNDTAVADGVLQVSQVGDPVGTSKTTTTGLITDSRTTI